MGQSTADKIPLGQKNMSGHMIVGNTANNDGTRTLRYYNPGVGYYDKTVGSRDVITDHCCGSCRAAGTRSKREIDPDDPASRRAARDVKRFRGHGASVNPRQ